MTAAANQVHTVEAPPGMRFVGYYCEHKAHRKDDGTPDYSKPFSTPHRQPWWKARPKYKKERGWDETYSTSRALHFPDFRETDAETHCQYRVPVFVRESDLAAVNP